MQTRGATPWATRWCAQGWKCREKVTCEGVLSTPQNTKAPNTNQIQTFENNLWAKTADNSLILTLLLLSIDDHPCMADNTSKRHVTERLVKPIDVLLQQYDLALSFNKYDLAHLASCREGRWIRRWCQDRRCPCWREPHKPQNESREIVLEE